MHELLAFTKCFTVRHTHKHGCVASRCIVRNGHARSWCSAALLALCSRDVQMLVLQAGQWYALRREEAEIKEIEEKEAERKNAGKKKQ